jgi:Ca2+-transporting ATPase
VFKQAAALVRNEQQLDGAGRMSLSDIHNLAFHGTLIAGGRGLGIVLKTGDDSSLGKLGKLLECTEAGATPIECQLEELGKQLCLLTVIISAVVSGVGILHHENPLLMVETGVALAVAAIPEGLPVLATLALAVGTQRMVRFKAILRHLAAVETLGCTSIICTDKTGTLTENQMTASKLYLNDREVEVLGAGYTPHGEFLENGKTVSGENDYLLQELLRAGILCNDSKLEKHDGAEGWHVHGDPTEGALLTLAHKAGLNAAKLQEERPRLAEIPFDLSRKRMSTLHQMDDSNAMVYTKGAPGLLIDLCTRVLSADGEKTISAEEKQKFREENERLAMKGLRVLALTRKKIPSVAIILAPEKIETGLTLIGLIAMHDPPREGVREAINECKRAGIKVLMLTGDQALTAEAVASELGISTLEQGSLITGKDLHSRSNEEISKCMDKAAVLARVTPELKLRIVKTLQGQGNIVSMTGDGVNDAPALKQANIGVAMGQQGTDLARSVSQMVITDDNFSTIVKAIEQGRIIYLNIQRAVGYLLTASLSSVVTVALGIISDIGLPLSPLQLLWLNLIMHIFPGLGIVLQEGNNSVMDESPRDPASRMVSPAQQWQIWKRSVVVSLAVLYAIAQSGKAAGHSTTIGLCTLSLCLLFQAWSWLSVESGSNKSTHRKQRIGKAMWFNMALAYMMLFAAIYMPGLTNILSTSPLSWSELTFSFLVALASVICTRLID